MFLANENFPRPSIILLRQHGFHITSIQEEFPGIPDEEVVKIAVKSQKIILTLDSDYGELIFKYLRQNPPSVIYFRDKGQSPIFPAQKLITFLSNPLVKIENSFTVIEETHVRQRFYG